MLQLKKIKKGKEKGEREGERERREEGKEGGRKEGKKSTLLIYSISSRLDFLKLFQLSFTTNEKVEEMFPDTEFINDFFWISHQNLEQLMEK